ncbi:MAG: DMT family transporter [Candidatus Paceibacterota bacterium]|jgi:drug/metabolite transporter (DMT)-like permease
MKNWSRFAFFIAAVLWGTSFAFQKTLLVFISPYSFIFWNFAVAFIILFCYATIKGSNLLYRLPEGLFLGALLAGIELFQTVGLAFTSSANTVFISNLGMLLIPYAGWMLFRHRVSLKDNVTVLLAVIGMYLLVGGVHGFGFGEAMLVLSAVCMAAYFPYLRRFEGEKSSHVLVLSVQQFFAVTVIAGAVVLYAQESFAVPSPILGNLFIQILVFTAIPYMMILWASQWADEMVAAIYDGVVEPLVTCVVAWGFFAEPTTRASVLGALLMVVAFSFASLFSGKHFLRRGLKALNSFVR